MSRIKGRYVAQITIECDVDSATQGLHPIEEIKRDWKQINEIIKTMLSSEFDSEIGKVEVTEMLNDVIEVEG